MRGGRIASHENEEYARCPLAVPVPNDKVRQIGREAPRGIHRFRHYAYAVRPTSFSSGSIPGRASGLSDEEDSTFRLHMVLLLCWLFLRRLDCSVEAALRWRFSPTGDQLQ